jgi:hypothetical protein
VEGAQELLEVGAAAVYAKQHPKRQVCLLLLLLLLLCIVLHLHCSIKQ